MKKFIVFGLGISGNAAAHFLLEQGFEVLAGDENPSAIDNLNKYLEEHPNLKTNLTIIKNIEEYIQTSNFFSLQHIISNRAAHN